MAGLYWEEWEIGAEFESSARTVTESDIVMFAGLSGDYNPLHIDEEFCKNTQFGDTRDLVGGGVVNWIWILLAVVWFAPNTQQLLAAYRPALALLAGQTHARFTWRPTPIYALVTAALALIAIFNLHKQSEFLYFQF